MAGKTNEVSLCLRLILYSTLKLALIHNGHSVCVGIPLAYWLSFNQKPFKYP